VTEFFARERFGIPDRVLVPVAFLVACALVVSRRPDAIAHAQFFAEDGAWWYAQAHDMGGLSALFVPYRNYLHTVPRLAAWLALGVPLLYAPLVMNLVAVGVQALPTAFICSNRMAEAIPRAWIRLLIGALYVALPNIWGTMTNVTNAQWHLAVLACAVVLSTPDPRPAWRAFDVTALAASGLSGPFAIFLVPVIAAKWWVRRERWLLVLGGVAATSAVVQLGVLLFATEQVGVRPPLGATVSAFLRVVVGRIVYGFMIGQTGYERLFADPSSIWFRESVLAAICVVSFALVVYALVKGSLELRLFVTFAGMALAAALLFPSREPLPVPFWENLTAPAASNRYFLIPIFALAVMLVWFASRPRLAARIAGVVVLLAAGTFGIERDWCEPPPLDYDFPRFVASYESAPSGTPVQILYPPGWGMVLTKR
jgi:hypothetical protein